MCKESSLVETTISSSVTKILDRIVDKEGIQRRHGIAWPFWIAPFPVKYPCVCFPVPEEYQPEERQIALGTRWAWSKNVKGRDDMASNESLNPIRCSMSFTYNMRLEMRMGPYLFPASPKRSERGDEEYQRKNDNGFSFSLHFPFHFIPPTVRSRLSLAWS